MTYVIALFRWGAGFRFLRGSVLTTMFAGLLVGVNNLFDYVLYPVGLCQLGFVMGVTILALISIPFNQALIAGFNWVDKEVEFFGAVRRIVSLVSAAVRMTVLASALSSTLQKGEEAAPVRWVANLRQGKIRLSHAMGQVGRTIKQHSHLANFLMISAYDPIPAMLFAQQVWGGERRRLGLASYAGLFLIATVVANGVWAFWVVVGLETIQALDQEFFAFISWCEAWATWTANLVGSSWQADFGLFRELLGTCKI